MELVKDQSLLLGELDEVDVPVFDKQMKKTLDIACAKALRVLKRAAKAVANCPGGGEAGGVRVGAVGGPRHAAACSVSCAQGGVARSFRRR